MNTLPVLTCAIVCVVCHVCCKAGLRPSLGRCYDVMSEGSCDRVVLVILDISSRLSCKVRSTWFSLVPFFCGYFFPVWMFH